MRDPGFERYTMVDLAKFSRGGIGLSGLGPLAAEAAFAGGTAEDVVAFQHDGVLLPDVDRAPLQGPFASSPGVALIEGSLRSPIPGLLPFPTPVVVLGVAPVPPTGLPIELAPVVPPETPPPVPCAKAKPFETTNTAANINVAICFMTHSCSDAPKTRSPITTRS